jgi:hypothetical protein
LSKEPTTTSAPLSSMVPDTADATPSDTSPTLDWGCDDYMVLSWIYGSSSINLLGLPWLHK